MFIRFLFYWIKSLLAHSDKSKAVGYRIEGGRGDSGPERNGRHPDGAILRQAMHSAVASGSSVSHPAANYAKIGVLFPFEIQEINTLMILLLHDLVEEKYHQSNKSRT